MKKERYFTSENIKEISAEIANELIQKLPRRRFQFDLSRSALLVLDMQQFFLDSKSHAFIPAAPAIIPGINTLLNRFRQQERPIIITQHANTKENAEMMGSWWQDILKSTDSLFCLNPRLSIASGHRIEKHQYDGFLNTDLDEYLKKNAIDQVVITGVMTHICCESTTRTAFHLGYEPFIAIDGTATYNRELHTASMLTMGHCCAHPVLIKDLYANE